MALAPPEAPAAPERKRGESPRRAAGKAPWLRACRRCGARTRAGAACRAPAVKGKRRCRMHGGAKGSGAPKGNSNRLVHGRRSAAAEADRRRLRELMRASRRMLAEMGRRWDE